MLERYGILKELLRDTALLTGDRFFQAATIGFTRLLGADFAFIARLRDASEGKMEVLASCRDGNELSHWWFDLPGTPCSVLYGGGRDPAWVERQVGGSVSISESVSLRFDSVRDAAFEAFIGIPLHDADRTLIGHVALFFRQRWPDPADREGVLEVADLFAFRVQAELHRCILEERREAAVLELERANRLLRTESITDHLTKLNNRRSFAKQMQAAFALYRRCQQSYSVLILDLDHFKKINDSFGHDIGDEVLRVVAQTLRANCRADSEQPFRVGGEEFVILCGSFNAPDLQRFGDRINAAIRALRLDTAPTLRLSVSIGAAWPTVEDREWTGVYRRADAAMYRAKQGGRDRTVLHGAPQQFDI